MRVHHLDIRDFRSIGRITTHFRRVNIILSAPRAPAEHILDALALWSLPQNNPCASNTPAEDPQDFLRHHRAGDLIRPPAPQATITLNHNTRLRLARRDHRLSVNLEQRLQSPERTQVLATVAEAPLHTILQPRPAPQMSFDIRAYRFSDHALRMAGNNQNPPARPGQDGALLPPAGANLARVTIADPVLWQQIDQHLHPMGLTLTETPEGHLWVRELQSSTGNTTSTSRSQPQPKPLHHAGEAIAPLLLNLAAVHANQDAVVVLRHPENGLHPVHRQALAQAVAQDDRNNQFFIATHSATIIRKLLELDHHNQVAVHTTRQDHEGNTTLSTLRNQNVTRSLSQTAPDIEDNPAEQQPAPQGRHQPPWLYKLDWPEPQSPDPPPTPRQAAESRLRELRQDAAQESIQVMPKSIADFREFLELRKPDQAPDIHLTQEGLVRATWGHPRSSRTSLTFHGSSSITWTTHIFAGHRTDRSAGTLPLTAVNPRTPAPPPIMTPL